MGRNIELPPELRPTQEQYELAKDVDKNFYKKTFDWLMQNEKGIEQHDAIDVLSAIAAERVALLIGFGLTDYDVSILRGVIERHLISLLIKE